MAWEKLPVVEGKFGGCLNCGVRHDAFPSDGIIAVGFGAAAVTCDGKAVYEEPQVRFDEDGNPVEADLDYWTGADAEEAAAKDPDRDWRISLHGPLSGREYQRQGGAHWVLIHQDMGFA